MERTRAARLVLIPLWREEVLAGFPAGNALTKQFLKTEFKTCHRSNQLEQSATEPGCPCLRQEDTRNTASFSKRGLHCWKLKHPSCFASKALGLLGCLEDPHKGDMDGLPVNLASSSPLGLCVLLYNRAQWFLAQGVTAGAWKVFTLCWLLITSPFP